MNVLIFSSTYLPVTGGVQYLLYWFLRDLDNRPGNNVTIYLIVPKYDQQIWLSFENVNVIEYEIDQSTLIGKIRLMWKLFNLIKDLKIEVINTWNAGVDSLLVIPASVWNRVPYVVACHGDDIALYWRYNYGLRKTIKGRTIVRLALFFAKKVVTISRDMVECVVDAGAKRSKVRLIPNGIVFDEESDFEQKSVCELLKTNNIPSDWIVMLSLSGHRPIKGHLNMLEAFAKIITQKPNFVLVIASHSTYTTSLIKKVHALQIKDHVRFVGFIHGEEKKHWYKIADIYINTAYFEPFGLTYLEAIQHDCAVLGAFNGGAKDMFIHEQTAYLIDPHSIKEIKEGILYLLDKNNRSRLIESSKKIMPHYTIGSMSDRYLELFKSAIQ